MNVYDVESVCKVAYMSREIRFFAEQMRFSSRSRTLYRKFYIHRWGVILARCLLWNHSSHHSFINTYQSCGTVSLFHTHSGLGPDHYDHSTCDCNTPVFAHSHAQVAETGRKEQLCKQWVEHSSVEFRVCQLCLSVLWLDEQLVQMCSLAFWGFSTWPSI